MCAVSDRIKPSHPRTGGPLTGRFRRCSISGKTGLRGNPDSSAQRPRHREAPLLRPIGLFWLLTVVLTGVPVLNPAETEDTGYLNLDHTHAAWPSPQSLVQDLRSNDPDVRLRALRLLGFRDQEAHVDIWSQTSPAMRMGQAVVTLDRVEVIYAALGEDATQQAIVAVQAGQTMFAAVAVPTARGWERIATSGCWCKYDMENALSEFVQLESAPEPGPQSPERLELVLRASGGGTGTYTQNEGHFRVYQGEVRLVMSFVSRRRRCDPTGPSPHWCDLEKRWLYSSSFGNVLGGVLVTVRGRFRSDKAPEALWSLKGLEDRDLGEPTCNTYKWNARGFQYEPIVVPDPCKPRGQ